MGIRGRLRQMMRPARSALVRAAAGRRSGGANPLLRRFTELWQPGWGQQAFDQQYRDHPDPFGPSAHPHELWKQDEQLAALGGRRYRRGLEVGCSQGSFTGRLADRCDELVAVDISGVAVERARRSLSDRPDVSVERMSVPFEFPEGDFDVVVCSDVLYYWERSVVDNGLECLVDHLRPGGELLLMHYRGEVGLTPAQEVRERTLALAQARGMDAPVVRQYPDAGPDGAGYEMVLLTRH
jgi:SAM-dependent methyltransferase